MRGQAGVRACDMMQSYSHIHFNNAASGADVTGQPQTGDQTLENYAPLILDVTGDDQYSLNTVGANSVVVRASNSAVAANQTVRVLPIERVAVQFQNGKM